jgi:hypothetical protein
MPDEIAVTIEGDGQLYAIAGDGSAWPVQEKSRIGRVRSGDRVWITVPDKPDEYATVTARRK